MRKRPTEGIFVVHEFAFMEVADTNKRDISFRWKEGGSFVMSPLYIAFIPLLISYICYLCTREIFWINSKFQVGWMSDSNN